VLMFVASGVAHTRTQKFTGSQSGTAVDVQVDADSDSCFTASNGATVCTDTSNYVNLAGKKSLVDSSETDSSGEGDSAGGGFTAQEIAEFDLVPGTTSCNIGGTMVPGNTSCTLAGSSEQGCLLQSVGPFSSVYRDNSSGDLLFSTTSNSLLCDDLSKLPNNFTLSETQTITGGTGKNAGATGTRTRSGHGQALQSDVAGHGFSWYEDTFTETITTP
jgi:hypothetical protein